MLVSISHRSATPWKLNESDEAPEAEAYETKDKQKAEKKRSSDSTTLKGVLWPGMDLFDSATPEMKRMRNQRKDESVLEQMITTSTEIEPNEIVYDLNGEVHHIRDIFGPLSSENSPVSFLGHYRGSVSNLVSLDPGSNSQEVQSSQDRSAVRHQCQCSTYASSTSKKNCCHRDSVEAAICFPSKPSSASSTFRTKVHPESFGWSTICPSV